MNRKWKCYTTKSLAKEWSCTEQGLANEMRGVECFHPEGKVKPVYPYWAIYGDPKPLLTRRQVMCHPGVMPANLTISEFWSECLTPTEVAKFLDIEPKVLIQMLQVGAFPGLKIGQAWGVLPDWVIRHLHKNVRAETSS